MREPVRRALRTLRASLREITIVVLGILIAFGLEAWWNLRANRRREADELRALQADFQQTTETLDRMVTYEVELIAAYDTILRMLESARPATRARVPRRHVRELFSTGTYDPPMGRVQSLISTGNIGLIRNDSLRARIAGWPALASEAREHQTRTRDFWVNDFAPSLRQHVDMAPYWRALRDTTIHELELPTSPEVTNLIYQLRFHAGIVATNQRMLLRDATALRKLIESEALPVK